MWIWIANKFAKFHGKRLNRSENIPKSLRGAAFLKHPVGVTYKLRNVTFSKRNIIVCYHVHSG